MPRFVLLSHDWPYLHRDLMLEQGKVLWTWRLPAEPENDLTAQAERLPDHRLAYLDYEGPVSGGRGSVRRVDSGICTILNSTENEIIAELQGARFRGTLTIQAPQSSTANVVFRT